MTVAIVGGAAGPDGQACARALAAAGHRVVAFDAEAIPADLPAEVTLQADTSQPAEALRVVGIAARLGEISVLVNNPGVRRKTPVTSDWQQAVDDWDSELAPRFRSVLFVSRATVPRMIDAGGGHIVNLSSGIVLPVGDGTPLAPDEDVFGALHWSLNGFTDAWARALKKRGVRVNGLCPDESASPGDVADFLVQVIASERTGENFLVQPGGSPGERPPPHRRITG